MSHEQVNQLPTSQETNSLNEIGASKHFLNQDVTGDNGRTPDNPPKRQKRGKYVSQACDECQKRKIKCNGQTPCEPCTIYERHCGWKTLDMRRRTSRGQRTGRHEDIPTLQTNLSHRDSNDPPSKELSSRLTQLEDVMQFVVSTLIPDPSTTGSISSLNEHEPSLYQNSREERTVTNTTPRNQRQHDSHLSTFYGETSIQSFLDQMKNRLQSYMHVYQAQASPSPQVSSPALTVVSTQADGASSEDTLDPNSILRKYDIDPQKDEWDGFLKVFCDEVHIMYPFIYLPSLWGDYTGLWNGWLRKPPNPNTLSKRDEKLLVTRVLICLAIGQCTASPRLASGDGRPSAGWGLYRAALDFLGDVFGCFDECENQILILQVLELMVIYLFRMDMIGKAEKILAVAISHAHNLGIHRKESCDNEMSRRCWWCLHVLDRRLAIESGRPFLIQDLNASTPLPQSLNGDMPCYRRGNSLSITPIDYLAAMVTYSRVLGKVWEALNGVLRTSATSKYSLKDQLECMLLRAQKEVPSQFACYVDDESSQREKTPWWLVKQQKLMRMRWHYLRVLICRSMSQEPISRGIADFENETICMDAASKVIHEFIQIPEQFAVFTFPFFHYLISSIILSLGLIVKESKFKVQYGNMIFISVQLLELYCHKTWVSGKLRRTVSKLSTIISRVLENHKSNGAESNHGANIATIAQSNFRCAENQEIGSLDTSLSCTQSIEWADMMMSDYDFEQEDWRRSIHTGQVHGTGLTSMASTHPSEVISDWRHHGQPHLSTSEICQTMNNEEVGHGVHGVSVFGQIERLDALFGNNIDPTDTLPVDS